MAPKSSKRGGSRKLKIKKSTVRDLKAPGRSAKAVKGGSFAIAPSQPTSKAPVSATSAGVSSRAYMPSIQACIFSA